METDDCFALFDVQSRSLADVSKLSDRSHSKRVFATFWMRQILLDTDANHT